MVPTPELAALLRRADVEHARSLTIDQKLAIGPELFEYICAAARAGIRVQHPQFDEQRVTDELRRRLEVVRQLDEPKRP